MRTMRLKEDLYRMRDKKGEKKTTKKLHAINKSLMENGKRQEKVESTFPIIG